MKTSQIILAAWCLVLRPADAQIVADGATNTLSNVTTNITGTVTVGTNGSFTLLVLSDNSLLTNSVNGVIGLNLAAKSNEVQLISPTARWRMGGTLYVGSNGVANRLVVSNGAFVENGDGTLGNRVDSSNNFALVTGSGSLWSNRFDLRVGSQGRGNQLVVSNGGWVASQNGFVGNNTSGSNNLAVVTGSGSVWSNAINLEVGLNGTSNRLVIEAGGVVHCDTGTVGGFSSASNNEALVTGPGSRWNILTDLTVGSQSGRNRLVVSNGAALVSGRNAYIGSLVAASNNVAAVTGAGSVWSNQSDFLYVGVGSVGNRLDVNGGGTMVTANGTIGSGSAANGNTVVVADAGSSWNNLADLIVGDSGSGNVLIASNGATVLASNLFMAFNVASANNRVTVDGGTLRVTNVAGTGVLDVRRGTNILNAGVIEVDRLLVTNNAGRFVFNGGTLSARSSKISNGQLFRVGDGVNPATFLLAGNGSHSFPNGLTVSANAVLTGNGGIDSASFVTVASGGTLAPGASIGKIIVSNTPSLQGNISMEISKNGGVLTNDLIEVRGVLALLTITYGGSLTVTNSGTNALAAGDSFKLFNAATYDGSFATITLPSLNPGLGWTNKLGVDGSIEVFNLPPPSVQTLAASAIAADAATLNGVANPNGSETTAWFEFGFTTNYGNVTSPQAQGSGMGNTNFSAVLGGLLGGITYHFRAVASNYVGVVFGTNQSFTTPTFADIGAGLPGVDSTVNAIFHSQFVDPGPRFVAWGDYDNDGRLDILLTGSTTNANGFPISQVWRNTGSGFTNINASLPAVWGSSAAWGDYDNDGRLDIVLAGEGFSGTVIDICAIFRNTINGFTNANSGVSGLHSGTVAWGDYDNDGGLDLFLAGRRWTSLADEPPVGEVWRNNGSGFAKPVGNGPDINAGLPPTSSAAWGDYDGDGRLDILLSGTTNADVNPIAISQVWRNTGSGFTNINAGLPSVWIGSIAWGDYDNDGRLDIVLTGEGANLVAISQVWRNTGSGFSNINAGLPGVLYGAAAWGDYDNDGRLDILLTGTTNSSGAISQIWRNTGSGFSNINASLLGVSGSSVAWGDYDNDGRLDILLAGASTGPGKITQVWRNHTPLTNTPPTAPTGLSITNSGSIVVLSWNASSDAQTPASGLTYNVRIGTTPGGSEAMSPMSSLSGLRRLPQMGNAQERLFTMFNAKLGTAYYWSVQAVDTAFAGSPFAPEQSFTINTVFTPTNGVPVPGDLNGDGIVNQSELAGVLANLNGNGIVNQSELDLILSNYFPNSPFLYMTNVAGLGGTNVTFALTNSLAGAFSVEFTTNLVDWYFLGPATPRYLFTDTNAPAIPQRYYRLRWP